MSLGFSYLMVNKKLRIYYIFTDNNTTQLVVKKGGEKDNVVRLRRGGKCGNSMPVLRSDQ